MVEDWDDFLDDDHNNNKPTTKYKMAPTAGYK